MNIDNKFKLRQIAGETIVVNQGQPDRDLTRIISLNSSARQLFEAFQGRDFTLDDVAAELIARYRIDAAQAAADATSWTEALKKCGIINA